MGRSARLLAVLAVVGAALAAVQLLAPVRAIAADPVLMAAGDVADCNTPYDEATAQLVTRSRRPRWPCSGTASIQPAT